VEEEIFAGNPSRFEIVAGFLRRQFHQGRGGRAKLAISTSVASRIVSTAISHLVLPITVRYLGNEGYGLMVTISSVVGWLQFTNMGIGLGLQNALTEETAKANRQGQKELVSTAIFSLAAIGLVLLGIGLVAFPFVDWLRVLHPAPYAVDNERFARQASEIRNSKTVGNTRKRFLRFVLRKVHSEEAPARSRRSCEIIAT